MPIDGRKVERYRVRQGKTRKELVAESGCSYSLIAAIERGKTGGSEKSAKAIADALGVTIDDIWHFERPLGQARMRRRQARGVR